MSSSGSNKKGDDDRNKNEDLWRTFIKDSNRVPGGLIVSDGEHDARYDSEGWTTDEEITAGLREPIKKRAVKRRGVNLTYHCPGMGLLNFANQA